MDTSQYLMFLPFWIAHNPVCVWGWSPWVLPIKYSKYTHALNENSLLSCMKSRPNFKTGPQSASSGQIATVRHSCAEPWPLHLPHRLWEPHDLSTVSDPTHLMGDGLTPGTISLLLKVLSKQNSTHLCISKSDVFNVLLKYHWRLEQRQSAVRL